MYGRRHSGPSPGTGDPNTISAVKIDVLLRYLAVFLCLFEFFRGDLNEAKVVCISESATM